MGVDTLNKGGFVVFGKRLSQLRKSHNLSQYDLADKLRFSRGQIANYEQGQRQPDYETLEKIADFFEISVDYLLGRTEDPSPTRQPQVKESSNTYDKEDDLDEKVREMMDDPETGIFFKDYLSAPEEKKKEMRKFMKFLLLEEKDRKPGDKQGE
jgi:transcriptional regulator with XRE-family HTH domain